MVCSCVWACGAFALVAIDPSNLRPDHQPVAIVRALCIPFRLPRRCARWTLVVPVDTSRHEPSTNLGSRLGSIFVAYSYTPLYLRYVSTFWSDMDLSVLGT